MNKTEAAYAQLLDLMLTRAKTIQAYWFERMTFKLADDTRYTPDFVVVANDGVIELHEVKGFMRDDAWVKLKVCADQFPFRVKLVKKVKGGWDVKDLTCDKEAT